MNKIRLLNMMTEAMRLVELNHRGKAASVTQEVLAMLLELAPAPEPVKFMGRPEDDPSRSESDRAAWREARGA